MLRPGEVAKVHIDSFKEEIGLGDRLLPIESQPVLNYMPKAPANPVEARVISVYDGVQYAGGLRIITLNRGSNEGLAIGDVLQLWRAGATIKDRTLPGNQFVKLPDEPIGLGFVFRVFPSISYALVQRATMPVEIGDRASDPTEGIDLPRAAACAGNRGGPRAASAAAPEHRPVSHAARAGGRTRCVVAADRHAGPRPAHRAPSARCLRTA